MAPQDSRRIDEIEVLRVVAAVMVVVDHIPFNLFAWHSSLGDFLGDYWNGSSGMDLFLAISGFVVARGLLPALGACQDTLGRLSVVLGYVARRLWRLWPAAWLWLAVPLVLSAVFNSTGAFHGFRANLASAVAGVLMVHDLWFARVFGAGDTGITYPYWALSLIEQLSLALPALALLLRRRLAWALLALLAWQFVLPHSAVFYSTRPGDFALGALLAIWSRQPGYALATPVFLRGSAVLRGVFLAALVVLLGALQSELPRPMVSVPFGLSAVLCGVLVYVASLDLGCLMQQGWLRRALAWAGSRAYAVTLTHLPAFALTRELYAQVRGPIYVVTTQLAAHFLVTGLVLTLVLSELTYRFVEQPARRHARALVLRSGPA